MSEDIKPNHGYFIESKMMMEGVEVPYRSVVVSSTPNGVEMNVDIHPSVILMDLKPKTSIQIMYRDWLGSEADKKWRLLGEGHFSAFGKFETSRDGGNRGITLMCRDFRMDMRKAVSSLIYDKSLLAGTSRKFATSMGLNNEDGELVRTQFNDDSKSLNPFMEVIKYTAVDVAGAPRYDALTPSSADGQYILDAFARGAWLSSINHVPFSQLINCRTRAGVTPRI